MIFYAFLISKLQAKFLLNEYIERMVMWKQILFVSVVFNVNVLCVLVKDDTIQKISSKI